MRLFIPGALAVPLLMVMLPTAVMADMYTWKDPETGRTRMSNIPPPWLRDGSSGPKVEVVRGSQVIDLNSSLNKPQPPAELSSRQRASAGLPAQDKPVAPPEPMVAARPADEDDP